MSSSGFVPGPFSKRVPNEYDASLSAPLFTEIFPEPVFRSPRQTAEASRFICPPRRGGSAASKTLQRRGIDAATTAAIGVCLEMLKPHVVSLFSSSPGTGKTTLAASLAAVFAAERPVRLVDADAEE